MTKSLDIDIKNNMMGYPGFDWKGSGFDIVSEFWKVHVTDASAKTLPTFIKEFVKGYNNRPSVRTSKKTGTIPDHLIDEIIQARIPKFSKRDITLISFGHRLSMATENILGLILEEYIHSKAIAHGWSCCWGNSIRSVDFCSTYKMLQVKNRSNTENSSSSKIRSGTRIEKWFRINAINGKTNWLELDRIIGVSQLFSEKEFIAYAKALIKTNPAALYVEPKALSSLHSA